MAYDGQRAMFEAFGRNKYEATGVIQWMLNNGWPANHWHLYDYYLQPAGGYFGTKISGEPLHIQYGYDDQGIAVVNHTQQSHRGLRATAEVYGLDMKRVFQRSTALDLAADGVARLFTLPPEATSASDVVFLRLQLADATGRVLSRNFYWLPRQTSQIDWSDASLQKHPYYSDVLRWEDLSALQQLPATRVVARVVAPVQPHAQPRVQPQASTAASRVQVQLHNPSRALALLVHVRLVDAQSGQERLPVRWSDNYVSLLPGERRTLSADYDTATIGRLALRLDGWNLEPDAAAKQEVQHAH
jgi:exo-1,4-beta-D-glucosaminidase